MEEQAQQAPPPVRVIVDEAATKDTVASTSANTNAASAISPTANLSPPVSPSPPASPPSPESRRSPGAEDYYSSRPRHDKLGNPIPVRRHPSAMASVYGRSKVSFPGDLGPNDPRRPRSPAPGTLPGDLGPNDPRRPSSRQGSRQPSENSSPAPGGHRRDLSNGSEAEGRLMKDPKETPKSPPPEDARHESDDDADADADNENDTDAEETKRGRERKRPEPGKTTAGKAINVRDDSDSERETKSKLPTGQKPDPTKGESKLSFLGPESAAKPKGKRLIHPSTAFDAAPSGISTPKTSDDESHSELRAAQKLSMTMSNVHSTPSAHRVIRQIVRGDYAHFQREAEEGRKRQRMYLVATDASSEAEYALEWTIGTVLRDGDTLFAVYAVDEESVPGGTGEGGVEIGKGADMVKDTASIIRGLNATSVPSPGPSPLARSGPLAAAAVADGRSRSRGVYPAAETERRKALEDVTTRCVRLLRKTRLQVRVVVEVFHCKSPRHMLTEIIDYLAPTLVIIGSRGQSAVKGVLLGSFSNYLVTKSSVPVMVARKKLRKHSKSEKARNKDGTSVPYQGTGRTARFSNVIEAPKTKGLRVKGWEQVGID